MVCLVIKDEISLTTGLTVFLGNKIDPRGAPNFLSSTALQSLRDKLETLVDEDVKSALESYQSRCRALDKSSFKLINISTRKCPKLVSEKLSKKRGKYSLQRGFILLSKIEYFVSQNNYKSLMPVLISPPALSDHEIKHLEWELELLPCK